MLIDAEKVFNKIKYLFMIKTFRKQKYRSFLDLIKIHLQNTDSTTLNSKILNVFL